MPDDNLTEEETTLALSAKDATNLIEMCNTNGWKVVKQLYIDKHITDCKAYLANTANTDMAMIQAKRELLGFVQGMVDDIEFTVNIGLDAQKELTERKEKKKKAKERGK